MEYWSIGVMVKMEGVAIPILQHSITPKILFRLLF
jgi:hypothetical protein